MTAHNYNRPLWKEGMFLAPQHLQQAESYRDAVNVLLTHAEPPFPWGIKLLEIDINQLANNRFVIQRLEAITPSREVLMFPDNIEVPSRSFEGVLSNPQQTAMVYLGLPELILYGPNLCETDTHETQNNLRLRYCAREVEVADENTGSLERAIEVKRLRGRLFFEGEDAAGFELLPLSRIKPTDNMSGAMLDEQYVPPLLLMSAWPRLYNSLESVAVRLGALQTNLMRTIGSKRIVEWCADPRGIELILKAQAVNQAFFAFSQTTRETAQPPYVVFNEILRAIGTFWVFRGDGKLPKVPFYNHLNSGESFAGALEIMRTLIAALDIQSYVTRPFRLGKGCHEVDLELDWIEKPMKLYVRVSGAGSYMDVVRNFVGVKACAPSHFMTALQRRVQGLQLLWQRRPPGSLPVTEDGVYAEVVKSGPFWPGVAKEQALAIGAAEELPYRFDLFVE